MEANEKVDTDEEIKKVLKITQDETVADHKMGPIWKGFEAALRENERVLSEVQLGSVRMTDGSQRSRLLEVFFSGQC